MKKPDSKKAEKLYKSGCSCDVIAEKLGISLYSVYKMKKEGQWIREKPKKKPPERKKGGQAGNQNAKGNKGNLKSGIKSCWFYGTLTDAEKDLLESLELDPEKQLIEEIRMLTLREMKLKAAADKYYKLGVCSTFTEKTTRETKRVFDGTPEEQEAQKKKYDECKDNMIELMQDLPGRDVQLTKRHENSDLVVSRIEDQLTRCTNAKMKAIADLEKMRADRSRLKIEERRIQLEEAKLELEKARYESQDAKQNMVDDWLSTFEIEERELAAREKKLDLDEKRLDIEQQRLDAIGENDHVDAWIQSLQKRKEEQRDQELAEDLNSDLKGERPE